MSPTRIVALVIGVLLLLALGRGSGLVLHEPLVGLANNFDMLRVQACIDAFPLRDPDVPARSNSWQAPLERYTFVDNVRARCFLTSEAIFAFAALPLLQMLAAQSDDGAFPLRALGIVKLLCLWAGSVWISALLARARQPTMALANAVIAVAVLFDPAVTIYLNSMYAEFAAVLFGYLAVGLTIVALVTPEPRNWQLVVLPLLIALACVSKIQHVLFGAFLLGMLLLVAFACRGQIGRRLIVAVAVGAMLGAAVQGIHMQSATTESIARANLTNTVLQAVFGASADPQRTAVRLGLPAECGDHAGKTWFTEGLQSTHPCPQLLKMSRLRLAGLAVYESATLFGTLEAGLAQTRPWTSNFLGLVARQTSAPLPDRFVSLASLLDALPFAVYALLFLLPPLLVGAALIGWRHLYRPAVWLALLFTALYPLYALPIVVFGDGLADVAKQFHLGRLAMLTFWLLAAMLAAQSGTATDAFRSRARLPRSGGSM